MTNLSPTCVATELPFYQSLSMLHSTGPQDYIMGLNTGLAAFCAWTESLHLSQNQTETCALLTHTWCGMYQH